MRSVLLVAIVVASLPPVAARAETRVLTLDPARTKITFRLGATLHEVVGVAPLARGEIRFDPAGGPAEGEIVFESKRLTTDLASRDEKMHAEVLKTASFPTISFQPERVAVLRREAGSAEVELEGSLSLLGVPHPLVLPAKLSSSDGRTVEITTRATIPYVAWGLADVSNFLLRVDKTVDVEVTAAGLLDGAPEGP